MSDDTMKDVPITVQLTAYAHAGWAGLIGLVRGASRDLSTNPKHFDGFGKAFHSRLSIPKTRRRLTGNNLLCVPEK